MNLIHKYTQLIEFHFRLNALTLPAIRRLNHYDSGPHTWTRRDRLHHQTKYIFYKGYVFFFDLCKSANFFLDNLNRVL